MPSTLRVFSDRTRTDSSPAGHSERTFAFLDRVAGSYWDQVRDLIEAWVTHYPADHRAGMVGSLTSDDAGKYQGAFWEPYLHEMFFRSGCKVEVHPAVPGSTRTPDFRVSRGDEIYYVEATCVLGRSDNAGAIARRQRLYDLLDKIDCPNFFLRIDVHAIGDADLPARPLRRRLERWVGGLDPDAVVVGEAQFEWYHAGWSLSFEPLPKRSSARGRSDHRTLGLFGPVEAAWTTDDQTLLATIQDKGSAYGVLDYPLVIAVNSFAFSSDHFDVLNALYGASQISVSVADPSVDPQHSRQPNGYWYRGTWAHKHVAGILLGESIAEYRVGAEPTYWSHPEPREAVAPLPCWSLAEPIGEHIEYMGPGVSIKEVLGLSTDWPVGDPFPREFS